MCRCIGGLAPGSNRIINAVRLVGGSDHNSFIRTPGIVPIGAPGIASFHLMSVGLIIRERVLSAMAASSSLSALCRTLAALHRPNDSGSNLSPRHLSNARKHLAASRRISFLACPRDAARAFRLQQKIFNHLVDYPQDTWYLWSTNEWRSHNGRT